MDERIEAFLKWFVDEKLTNLSDEEFNLTISTLIKMKSQADVTLAEEVTRNWAEINSREYLFDRCEKDIKLLENCQKSQMVEFMKNLISKQRRKLSVQVVGSKIIDDEVLEDKPDEKVFDIQYHTENGFIDDIVGYKSTLKTYSLHKIVE